MFAVLGSTTSVSGNGSGKGALSGTHGVESNWKITSRREALH
jgi:hypothetical protein